VKVILSRKGFDSSVGGHASPILPDGTMLSLPIPSTLDRLCYDALVCRDGSTYARVIEELDAGARIAGCGAHLDPDLVEGARRRRAGWRAAFGQIGAAAGHLRNQQVGVGDLFLFYGWFRHAERIAGRLQFVRGEAGFHSIFGYLEVGDVLVGRSVEQMPAWLLDHPHAEPSRVAKAHNTIFVAADRLNAVPACAGAGALRYDNALVLTCAGASRSRWRLARSVFGHVSISYHTDAAWRDGHFQSYPRAQEYVIDADSGVADWALDLIRSSAA
jgi:Nucleotide modification associated domain 3